jgi:hypothetical protein
MVDGVPGGSAACVSATDADCGVAGCPVPDEHAVSDAVSTRKDAARNARRSHEASGRMTGLPDLSRSAMVHRDGE